MRSGAWRPAGANRRPAGEWNIRREGAPPPEDFPPFTTVRRYFYMLRNDGTLDLMNEALATAARPTCH